ncbi:MAG TPA: histidine kinase, partial [Acidimicrobiales bacterium]|nr:histidine kinase [Acidimicrobiales bacterium]
SRLEVWAIGGCYVVALLAVPRLLFYDPADAGCTRCAANLLLVHRSYRIYNDFALPNEIATAALSVVLVVLLARHWLSAHGYARRQMNALVLATLPVLAFVTLKTLPGNEVSYLELWGWGVLLLLAPPVAYLVRVVRAGRAERAVGTALVEMAPAVAPAALRDALARALGDPSLQLAFGSAAAGVFVDTDGAVVDLGGLAPGRVVTPLDGSGQGVLVHDEQLANEAKLVQVTVAATNLALEHGRLRAEVEAQLEVVQASRARIVEAGDAARRRFERDLHDGAQQRLVTLALALSMAHDRAGALDPELAALLDTAGKEAKEALGELRELARGIHPAVLTQSGLAGAIEALVERSPLHVSLEEVVRRRLPEAIEATAYFVVSEALTNTAKHAPGATVRIAVRDERDVISVTVADDGPGGARLEAGSGLTGLADRVASVGGSFSLVSAAGHGTRVEARLPTATRQAPTSPSERPAPAAQSAAGEPSAPRST